MSDTAMTALKASMDQCEHHARILAQDLMLLPAQFNVAAVTQLSDEGRRVMDQAAYRFMKLQDVRSYWGSESSGAEESAEIGSLRDCGLTGAPGMRRSFPSTMTGCPASISPSPRIDSPPLSKRTVTFTRLAICGEPLGT